MLPALPCPGGHAVAKGAIIEIITILRIADVLLATLGQRQFAEVGVCFTLCFLIEAVPRNVDMRHIIKIPSYACRYGTHSVTIYLYLATPTAYNETFVLRTECRIEHKAKLSCRSLASYAVHQRHHRCGINGLCTFLIFYSNDMRVVIYLHKPMITGYIARIEKVGIKFVLHKFLPFGKCCSVVCHAHLASLWSIDA